MLVASHFAAVCTGRCCHGAVAAAAACLPMWQEPGMGHDSSESSQENIVATCCLLRMRVVKHRKCCPVENAETNVLHRFQGMLRHAEPNSNQ